MFMDWKTKSYKMFVLSKNDIFIQFQSKSWYILLISKANSEVFMED